MIDTYIMHIINENALQNASSDRICIAREPEVKENSSVEDKTLISGFSPEGNHSTSFQIH